MSALAALADAYMRLGDSAPPFGYSTEKIGFLISLNEYGTPTCPPIDLREGDGPRNTPRLLRVPRPVKRTSGIAANFLWDKTSYVLGVTAGTGKRILQEHSAFVQTHKDWLRDTDDIGLIAFRLFVEKWDADEFERVGWPEEMKDQNVVFALERERRANVMIHDRPAARAMWARIGSDSEGAQAACLVTGLHAPIARLHPAIKGVWGAQTSGANLVSFNLDAFASYGHEQGDNAPVSEAAAFAYTTALNRFLEKGSKNRVQIGDASTAFWADASRAESAVEAEGIFARLLGAESIDEGVETKRVEAILDAIRKGRPIADLKPELPPRVRFFVLGLAPNAARLSVRFFIEDDFQEIAVRYLGHLERMRIDPPAKEDVPSIWRLLIETAPQRKSENIPQNLAGEWLRAILMGGPYPLTLLATVLMRIRADKEINALRMGILKAVLNHNFDMGVPVALDPENKDTGYLLGRLFAVLERTQTLAQGSVNASIKDRYYGAASATPRTVFPLLLRLNAHHQGKAESKSRGLAGYFAQQLSEVMDKLPTEFPATLNLQRQGTFALGYFHQMNRRKKTEAGESTLQSEE